MDFREMFARASQCMLDGAPHDAMALLDKILLDHPDFHLAWNARGATLNSMGDSFDAVLCFDRAVQLVPSAASYYLNRGVAYMGLERFEQALEDYKEAEIKDNKVPEIFNNRGNALMHLRRPAEAVQAYQRAVELKPDYADAHVGVAMATLMLGDYIEGFKEFEWRWKSGPLKPRGFNLPMWTGERATDSSKILLLYGEQGMGDVLQFVRYAPFLKAKWGGQLWLEVGHPLSRLLRYTEGVDGVVSLGERIPKDATHVLPMVSAPVICGSSLATIPNHVPYIRYDVYRAKLWADKLKALPPGLLVGVCWAGMNRDKDRNASSIDSRRSITLDRLKPLGGVKGISWVSLQLGLPKEQIRNNPAGMTIFDGTDDLHDWYDTAALVANLDLVITVDTSVAHLAAGMGKPTWVLCRHDSCWRWLMDRDDSPWYPTIRLFTQKVRHDWDEVIRRVHVALLKEANQHRLRNVA